MKILKALIILGLIAVSTVSMIRTVKAQDPASIEFRQPNYAYLGDHETIEVEVSNTGADTLDSLWLGVDLIHRTTFDDENLKDYSESAWWTLYTFTLDEPVDKVNVKTMARIDRGLTGWGEGRATIRIYWTPTGGSEVQKGSDVVIVHDETSFTVKDLASDEILGSTGTLRVKASVENFNLWGITLLTDWAVCSAERRIEATKTPIKPSGASDYGGIDFGIKQGLALAPGKSRTFTAKYQFHTSKAYVFDYTYGAYYWDMAVWKDGYPGQPGSSVVTRAQKPFTIPYTFDMTVSIEWDIDPTDTSDKGPSFTSELVTGLRKASNFLFDATDGQMCFAQITIYDDKEHWHDSTLQIHEETVGDNPWDDAWPKTGWDFDWAWPPVTTTISMGYRWTSNGVGQYSSFDGETGITAYKTIIHEFGHYQFGLKDEYMTDPLAYGLDHQFHLWFVEGDAYCDSLMWRQWQSGEFCNPIVHRESRAVYQTDTFQERYNHKSCWSTIKVKYPWIYIPMEVNIGPEENVGRDISFESSLLPKPIISSVNFESAVALGSEINIDAFVTNNGQTSTWQTIAISFPVSQPFPTKITKLETDLDSYSAYSKGDTVNAIYSAETMTLETYLLEGYSSDWENGETYHLRVAVTPSISGPFVFYVKSVAGLIDVASNWAPNRAWSQVLDQQGEYVYSYTVNVGGAVTNEFSDAILVNQESLLDVSTQGDSRAFHVFTSPVGFLGATEGTTFLVMSTGIAENIPGSPGHFESTDFNGYGTAGDTVSLTLELVVPSDATTLSFDFRFLSEEYPEWVGSPFNDFFYAFLTNSSGTYQIAYDDNGNIINVNNNFFNPNIYPIGTVFDGSTKRLTTTVDVNGGEAITLRFMVGDVGDGIYDTGVFIDNVRFNVGPVPPGTTPTADVIVVKTGPNSVEQGKLLTYTLNYFNIEEASAENVVVTDHLPSQASFVSASSGGIFSSATHSVTWNLGILPPFSSGVLTLTVVINSGTSIGTILENTASISTTSQESSSQNNGYSKSTTVTAGASLPPNVEVGPTVSNYNGIPVLYWTTPTTFTYHGDSNVIGVDINIHLPDGGPDIGGPMTNTPGTYDWTFTYTFYPRHGKGTVTYTVHYADGSQDATAHNILVDPSGYVYNAITGERIEGATVTLFRFDTVLMQFVIVPHNDPGIDPQINPQITDENGGYGWMVSPGMYMVQVEKEGYATNFAIVTVPPPATDLNIALTPIDTTPPTTEILISTPYYVDSLGTTYITSETSFTLTADDGPDGSGVGATYYRHYNLTYDSHWTGYSDPFYLDGLEDGTYSIDYYSIDVVGNVEPTNIIDVTLDNTAPNITVLNPPVGWALQDGVAFLGSITDAGCGVFSISFSIREANGDEGIPIGFEDLPALYDPITGEWSLSFDTLLVPDGHYILCIEAEDNLGNEASTTIPYSIRNWAVIELLPASEDNKVGRTMPVKFALRVVAEVDPEQPFVYNEELRIDIYATSDPAEILQESYFGDSSRDYRISSVLYITNFKTLKSPEEYTVEIYRDSFDVGGFTFETVK